MKIPAIKIIIFSLALGLTVSSLHAQGIEVRPVHFSKGASAATLNGKIVGDQTIDYKLGAKAGQKMEVSLNTNNTANYFNVLPPGSETALVNSSVTGNQWTGDLPANGEYTIRVYLMRSAARRHEKAAYTLKVAIHGSTAASAQSGDAKVPGTNYHATGQVPCAMDAGQPTGHCNFGVVREGNGSCTVTVTKPDGRTRAIFFKNGTATGFDKSQADSGKFAAKKQSDLYIVSIGSERYEIPDVVVYGD